MPLSLAGSRSHRRQPSLAAVPGTANKCWFLHVRVRAAEAGILLVLRVPWPAVQVALPYKPSSSISSPS
jgi:hypothetical protein